MTGVHGSSEPRYALAACVLVALLGVVAACGSSSDSGDPGTTTGVVTSTVTAQERRITSVLTLDAVVVVNPFVRIAAPETGVLVTMRRGRVGIVAGTGEAPVPVELPENTEIVSLLLKPGTRVTEGLPIINARYTGLAMQATVAPEQIYRLYDGIISVKGQVQVGPGPFDTVAMGIPYPVGAITLPEASASPATLHQGLFRMGNARIVLCDAFPDTDQDSTDAGTSAETSTFPVVTSAPEDLKAGVVVVVKTPADLNLIEGMPGRVALVTAESTGVALPIEAVAGISKEGQVYVVEDGVVGLRDVTLGITDGSYVEITSGLALGEVVQIPSPSIVDVN